MRYSSQVVLLLVLQLLGIAVLAAHAQARVSLLEEKRSIAKALELSDLVIATDCYSTRNPSIVDFSGCFRDMPTQLCYHASCTGFGRPRFEGFDTRLEVER
jgi:hypothetical protein